MSDRYSQIVNTPPGKLLAQQLGLPRPVELDRRQPESPVLDGTALVGSAPGGPLTGPLREVLAEAAVKTAGTVTEIPAEDSFKALVFDASGITDSTELVELQGFFYPALGRLGRSGRVVVLGLPPASCREPRQATAQRALEGFTRSLGKEVGRGATVNLMYVAPDAVDGMASTLRFLLSPRSAYVSGQVVRIGGGPDAVLARAEASNGKPTVSMELETLPGDFDWERPLAGKVALITGASRGIGLAIAETLHHDGAELRLLDVPALGEELRAVADRLGGEALELDITDVDAPERIIDRVGGELDVVVHNAGITRDRTLAKMPADRWSSVIEVNLASEERINEALLASKVLRPGGRIVCVSSMSGIAGNAGQTNYAASKAGVIGMVESLAPLVAEQGLTINAVAPGFIETEMTAKIPIAIREVGRRMNSLSQGGKPVDVAETIAWLASPASGAINGNTVRVCGQSQLGA